MLLSLLSMSKRDFQSDQTHFGAFFSLTIGTGATLEGFSVLDGRLSRVASVTAFDD